MFKNMSARLKRRLDSRIQQAEREDRFDILGRNHSKAYHRFFEGYSEFPVLDQGSGRIKIRRVYTGRLYVQRLSQMQRVALKCAYVLLLAAAFALFGSAMVMTDVPCNYFWYVTAAGAVVFVGLLWTIPILTTYLPASGELKISEYNSGAKALRSASYLCAAASAATMLLGGLSLLLNQLQFSGPAVPYMLRLLFSAALFLAVGQLEAHVPYDIRMSGAEAPEGAVEIS